MMQECISIRIGGVKMTIKIRSKEHMGISMRYRKKGKKKKKKKGKNKMMQPLHTAGTFEKARNDQCGKKRKD
jgi:hypothetical protein